MSKNIYENPLITRYASEEMAQLFSAAVRYTTWRQLWVALAKAQKELGIDISREQIEEMEAHTNDINYAEVAAIEQEVRHDVVAHLKAFGNQCPTAKGIIHLGATSAFVTDNADLIILRKALKLIRLRLLLVVQALSSFARTHAALPTLGFTHFQPAQLTTVGKRAALWLQDLLFDFAALNREIESLCFRGAKGTTGTQASYLRLFNGDQEKVEMLDQLVTEEMGFDGRYMVIGQTYPRKIDSSMLAVLSGIGQSTAKFSNDLRLLQHLNELEEPFEERQVGSSAMAYKRNPVRSERMASLSRFLIVTTKNADLTAASQWLERSLDDSANRRIVLPEAFLAADALMLLYYNVAAGLTVRPHMIQRHVEQELPFQASELILLEAVKRGADRQEIHERLRRHAMAAKTQLQEGGGNSFLDLISSDEDIPLGDEDITPLLEAKAYIGRAPEQVAHFIDDSVTPILKKYAQSLEHSSPEVRV